MKHDFSIHASPPFHLLNKEHLASLEPLEQVISLPLMDALKQAALDNAWSIDQEVSLRLLMSLLYPSRFSCSSLLDFILNKKFSKEEIEAENKRKKEAWIKFFKENEE